MGSCSPSVVCNQASARWRCHRIAKRVVRRSMRLNRRTSWVNFSMSSIRMMPMISMSLTMPMPPTNKSLITKARSLSANTKRCNSSQTTLLMALHVIRSQPSAQASSYPLLTPSAKRDVMMRLHHKSLCRGQPMATRVHLRNLPRTLLWKSISLLPL